MSYFENMQTITMVAGDTVTKYCFVYVDSNGKALLAPLAGTNAAVVGVAQNDAAAGESVTVAISGVSKVLAAATVTAGASVMVGTADGKIADHSGITKYKVGLALTGAAAGSPAAILIRPMNLVDTTA